MGIALQARLMLWGIVIMLFGTAMLQVYAFVEPIVRTALASIPVFVAPLILAGAALMSAVGRGVARGSYPATTVGVRKRVTREAVATETPCTVCGAPETRERAHASKAVVVAGAVVAEYDAVQNHYCHAHASGETMLEEPTVAAEPEPAVATDGGTPLDDAADDIETADSVYAATVQVLLLTPVVAIGFAVVLISRLFAPKQP